MNISIGVVVMSGPTHILLHTTSWRDVILSCSSSCFRSWPCVCLVLVPGPSCCWLAFVAAFWGGKPCRFFLHDNMLSRPGLQSSQQGEDLRDVSAALGDVQLQLVPTLVSFLMLSPLMPISSFVVFLPRSNLLDGLRLATNSVWLGV